MSADPTGDGLHHLSEYTDGIDNPLAVEEGGSGNALIPFVGDARVGAGRYGGRLGSLLRATVCYAEYTRIIDHVRG